MSFFDKSELGCNWRQSCVITGMDPPSCSQADTIVKPILVEKETQRETWGEQWEEVHPIICEKFELVYKP